MIRNLDQKWYLFSIRTFHFEPSSEFSLTFLPPQLLTLVSLESDKHLETDHVPKMLHKYLEEDGDSTYHVREQYDCRLRLRYTY